MSDQLISSVVTVLTAIVGVAIISVLVSKNANTSGVITAGGNAFSNALGTAISPLNSGGGFGTFPGGGLSAGLNF